jgi:hypothetical protein
MTSVLEDPEFEQDLSETMHPPKMMISLAQAQEMDHKRKGVPKSEPEVEKKKDSGLSRDM